LFDLKNFSNTSIGTHFSLSGEIIQTTWSVVDMTGNISNTGSTVQVTWFLQELTGDDELFLKDTTFPSDNSGAIENTWVSYNSGDTWSSISSDQCPKMPTVDTCPSGQEKYIVSSSSTCWIYYSCRKIPSSSNGLSAQEKRKTENILQWFGN
jgi:hypothetical protein